MRVLFLSIILSLILCSSIAGVDGTQKYTENERQAIQKFRQAMGRFLYKDYMKEDAYLIRWLRARDMNVDAARLMLLEAIKWRHQNHIDNILQEEILGLTTLPFYTDGVDKSGNPVGAFMPGQIDLRKYIVGANKRQEVVRLWDQFLEFADVGLRSLMKNTSDVTGGSVIFDLRGYSIPKHGCLPCVTTYYDWIKHYENYYPGLGKNFIVINAPKLFLPFLDLLKSVMSKQTLQGIKVFGEDKDEWKTFLLSFISSDQLRPEFGGTMKE